MQDRTRIPAGRRLSVLLLAVLLVVAASLTLLTNSETSAQTESAPASELSIPVLTARATGSGVQLSWEAVSGAVRYELLTWWAGDPGWQAIGGDGLTGTSYTHADVTAGRTYLYSIRALNAAGEASPWLTGDYPTPTALAATGGGTATVTNAPGPTSTSTSTSTPTATATASASGLSIPALTARATGSGVLLSWEAVAGAVRYELLTWWADDPGWQAIGGGGLTGTSYTHASVVVGRTYFYTIRAIYAGGEGPWLSSGYPTATALAATGAGTATPTVASAPASGPTPTVTSTPTATATATASASGLSIPALTARATGSGVLLSWEAVAGAVRYELLTWWADDPGWQAIGGGGLTGTSYTHASVVVGRTYFYTIRAIYAGGEGPWLSSGYPTATALAATGSGTPTPTVTATPGPAAPTTERDALIALFAATDGANWTDRGNWLSQAPLETWHGVTTDENGRVTELRLSGNGLRGSMPNLGALAYLETLFLSSNRLSGPVPELGALAKLTRLDLSRNRLSGPIPDLSALVRLERLLMANNRLSGSIPELSALVNLRSLELGSNRLSGTIPDLSALVNLRSLALDTNELSGTIPDLNALGNLASLALQHNRLSGPLPDLGAAARLVQLNLTGNQLCLPGELDLADLRAGVAAHVRTLNLSPCAGGATATATRTPCVRADVNLHIYAHGNRDRAGVGARHSGIDGAGDGARRSAELGSGVGRGALRAVDVVGCGDRLAGDRRRQPDRDELHARGALSSGGPTSIQSVRSTPAAKAPGFRRAIPRRLRWRRPGPGRRRPRRRPGRLRQRPNGTR